MHQKVLILDFGSQYTQLIARRVRELNIFSEIIPFNKAPEDLSSYKAVILSGSPHSVRSDDAPRPDLSKIKGKMPLLGVCFGAQFMAANYGGKVEASSIREYGRANLKTIHSDDAFLKGIEMNSQVWMSHSDTITELPEGAICLASTADVKNAAYRFQNEDTYAIQFHPEVYHSTQGTQLISNFLMDIADFTCDWTPDAFVQETVAELKETLGDDRVILGLSGGVDSSVAALLLHQAIGSNLHCIFVNNGLLRKNEFEEVLEQYKGFGLNVKGVDATNVSDAIRANTDQIESILGKLSLELENINTKILYQIYNANKGQEITCKKFWEKEFPTISPKKNKKGKRLFTPKDILKIERIYILVKEEGYTLDGAKKALNSKSGNPSVSEQPELTEPTTNNEVIDRLEVIKKRLIGLRTN